MRAPTLELRHLATLTAVAETGSVTRAASRLHVSQSAVSHQLAEIEGRLGRRLFVRGQAMRPTDEGRRVLGLARGVIEGAEALERALGAAGPAARVRVATGCYTCYHWLPPLLPALRERVPGAEVEIVLEATRRPLEALREHRIDLAITSDRIPRGRGLVATPLFDDELLALVGPGHPLASRPALAPRDLAAARVLAYDAPLEDLDVWTRLLRPAGARPETIVRVPLTEAIVELARAGQGVGILAGWAARPYLRGDSLVAVPLRPALRRRWQAVRRDSDPAARVADALAEGLRRAGGGPGT